MGLTITPYKVRVVDVIDFEEMCQLPEFADLKDQIYDDMCMYGSFANYCDGDFTFPISFKYMKDEWVQTLASMLPPEVVERDLVGIAVYQ